MPGTPIPSRALSPAPLPSPAAPGADLLRPGAPWAGPLAPRELLVLALLSTGYRTRDLPALLRTTFAQVAAHASAAAAALGVADWRAVAEARRRGLID